MVRIYGVVVATVALIAAVAIGLGLVGGDGPGSDELSLGGLTPLFDPDAGFAGQTSNCPTDRAATRDPDAEALAALLPDALSAARQVHQDAVLRSLALDRERDTATLYFSRERGGPPVIYVSARRPFAEGASQRIEVKTDDRISIPRSIGPLNLDELSVGPDAAIELVKARAGDLDRVAMLSLSYEGCHLVWAIVGLDAGLRPILGRVNNTTGELRLEPPPAQ
jgi:hypothetical protein